MQLRSAILEGQINYCSVPDLDLTYLWDLLLDDPPDPCIELQMFLTGHELIQSIELRAITHGPVHILHSIQDTV